MRWCLSLVTWSLEAHNGTDLQKVGFVFWGSVILIELEVVR